MTYAVDKKTQNTHKHKWSYADWNGPSETKPNLENCKNCSSECTYDCAQLNYTIQRRTVLMLSIRGKGAVSHWQEAMSHNWNCRITTLNDTGFATCWQNVSNEHINRWMMMMMMMMMVVMVVMVGSETETSADGWPAWLYVLHDTTTVPTVRWTTNSHRWFCLRCTSRPAAAICWQLDEAHRSAWHILCGETVDWCQVDASFSLCLSWLS